jgi:hypothetical protein
MNQSNQFECLDGCSRILSPDCLPGKSIEAVRNNKDGELVLIFADNSYCVIGISRGSEPCDDEVMILDK